MECTQSQTENLETQSETKALNEQADAKCYPLTEAMVAEKKLNPQIVRYIERCRLDLGLAKDEIRILDLGCGNGGTVAYLHDQGYSQTFGIDVDASYVENGRPLFEQRGRGYEEILRVTNEAGEMSFVENFFHLVFSEQVFEHLEDLSGVARELQRVTQPGGWGYHTFTASKTVMEGHYHLPLVHWLPKNGLRRLAMLCLYGVGFCRQDRLIRELSVAEMTQESYTYSVNATFYRSPGKIKSVMEAAQLRARFVTVENPKLEKLMGPLFGLTRFSGVRMLVGWLLLNFRRIELVTRKPSQPKYAAASSHIILDMKAKPRIETKRY